MAKLVLDVNGAKHKIDRNIYGHFAEHLGRCIYEGFWVGEDSPIPNENGIRKDVVGALKKIRVPVLRWPGGCFADEYHWKDGVGPREKRPKRINNHWGGVIENNHFGTHEYFELCRQLGAEPYICGNVGSGTVWEMQQWVEYITFPGDSEMANWRRENGREEPWRLKYFGIGNENWNCGGKMRAEYYADLYRQYQNFVRNYGDNEIFRIACGPRNDDYHWTEVLMSRATQMRGMQMMDGLALHYYTVPGEKQDSAVHFDESDWHRTMRLALFMEELIIKHSRIMDKYDPEKRVALIVDEWGTWFGVEPGTEPGFLYQQNTLRDALVAGLTLNIFNNYCERVKMANIAQIVNVLQALILTRGPEMVVTPTYHVFDLYQVHQDATLIPTELTCESYVVEDAAIPELNASASVGPGGSVNITLCNLNPHKELLVSAVLDGFAVKEVASRVLTSANMNDHNTFEQPDVVRPRALDSISLKENHLSITLPPKSVALVTVR